MLTLCLLCCFHLLSWGEEEARTVTAAPEVRAVWVDAFHAGIRTPQEVEKLVADAWAANINVLIVQVRRRGDSLYRKSLEPPLREAPYDPEFDALAYVIEKAHERGIEVHAWVNAMPIWRDAVPPSDANHVYHLHGPEKAGVENWLTASPTGAVKFPVGYFLDAGHPAAADHVAKVCANIVRNYKIDGLHLDYIRYPETTEALPQGAAVGYNPVSLERFRRWAGGAGTALPAPNDALWTAWRRQQITQLVRRIYLETKLVNPEIKVSAAVIAWGRPPRDEKDFANVAPMQRIFQDWHGWMREGILDLSLPMNYAREHNPVVRGWFDGWIAWQKKHKHGRQMIVGVGSYLNRPQGTLAQIQRVRQGKSKTRADGLSLYSYHSLSRNGEQAEEVLGIEALSRKKAAAPAPFAEAAPVPQLPAPEKGWLLGRVLREGSPWDGGAVKIKRSGWSPFRRSKTATADGNGYFGATGLKPGTYTITLLGAQRRKVEVRISSGRTSFIEIAE